MRTVCGRKASISEVSASPPWMPWRISRARKAARIAEPVPGRVHREHPVPDPQLARDDVDDGDVAAVRVDEDELAAAGPVHALADLRPGADQGLGRQGERAGKGEMLVRLADRLDRQDEHVEIVRHERQRRGRDSPG